MRILHINGTTKGGVFNGIKYLHSDLLNNEIESFLFLPEKIDQKNIIYPGSKFYNFIKMFKNKISKIIKKFFLDAYQASTLGWFYSYEINKVVKKIEPDIIHIHWIGNELMSIKQILGFKKKVVFTLHDMWMILPHQHYSLQKKNYKESFISKKISNYLLNEKKKIDNTDVTFTVTSEWMKNQFLKKNLYPNSKVFTIPYGINFSNWEPLDKFQAKNNLGINSKKRLILFTAFGPNNPRKGLNILLECLKSVNFDFELVISSDVLPKNNELKDFIFLKDLNSSEKRRILYSACDILVAPSIEEAFGLVALESLSCNLPSVAFENTGFEETIKHKKNGYLAKYLNKDDFAEGIKWVNNMLNSDENFFINSRKEVELKFNNNKILQDHIKLYEEIQKKN